MSISLGSNIASLRTQRYLRTSSDVLGKVYERLSSGQRINRASDDPAGLSVATVTNNQRKLHSQASRNIGDGISLLSIAESALSSQQTIVTRMSEIAEQAANGALSNTQRTALNKEYYQLSREFQRIAETSRFNGVPVLGGNLGETQQSVNVQIGVSGADESALSLTNISSLVSSGVLRFSPDTNRDGAFNNQDITPFTGAFAVGGSLASFAEGAQQAGGSAIYFEVTGSDGRNYRGALGIHLSSSDFAAWLSSSAPSVDTPISNFQYAAVIENPDGTTATFGSTGVFNLSGSSLNISGTINGGAATGSVSFDFRQTQLLVGDRTTRYESSIYYTGVESAARAGRALELLNNRGSEISLAISKVGASQSRLESAFVGSVSTAEQYAAAAARILDADVAEDASQLAVQQILQQSAAAVLAQANLQPQLGLQLLNAGG